LSWLTCESSHCLEGSLDLVHATIDHDLLTLREAIGIVGCQPVAGERFHMDRSIKPRRHHLRDTAAIVTIRLSDLRLQHGPHVPRLDTDHLQACFDQSAVKPLRQWSGFQPHALEEASAVLQQWQ
jgi:hypothetical protein